VYKILANPLSRQVYEREEELKLIDRFGPEGAMDVLNVSLTGFLPFGCLYGSLNFRLPIWARCQRLC